MNRWIKRAVVAWAVPMATRKAQQMLANRKAAGTSTTSASRGTRKVRTTR